MARILDNPDGNRDRVIVEYSPEEVLPKQFYITDSDGIKLEKPVTTGHQIGSAIQSAAWRDLCMNAPQIVEKRVLKYGNIQVIDGKFTVTFYEEAPSVINPPSG